MKNVVFVMFVVLTLVAAVFCGCTNADEQKTLVCYVPDGAPALAVANVIQSGAIGTRKVQTTITTGDDVVAKCQSGEADFAILPTNAAVTVCSVRKEYCFFSVNVKGLLYLVGTREIANLAGLQGERVLSIGLGNTPEYVFKKILDSKGITHTTDLETPISGAVNLKYATDGSTIIPLVLNGSANFAVLGEPAATNLINKAQTQGKTVFRLGDLQQLWQSATNSSYVGYPQAGLVVKRSLVNAAFAQELATCLTENAQFLSENCAQLNQLMQDAGSSLNVNYTQEILARCNLTFEFASAVKADIATYLETFPALKKCDDSIFYEKNR